VRRSWSARLVRRLVLRRFRFVGVERRHRAELRRVEHAALAVWVYADHQALRDDLPALADYMVDLYRSLGHKRAIQRNQWALKPWAGSGREGPAVMGQRPRRAG
jgi:hypothetical protein